MEWTCAKCQQAAAAAEWRLLGSMGWVRTPEGEVRCVLCARKKVVVRRGVTEPPASGPRTREATSDA